ncbi:hypothetical protein C0992_006234 [Termitomyces sp. T32_za158]|nr:hypothetical protein C0992_006234 [Termitomyces sp. T32_za158]
MDDGESKLRPMRRPLDPLLLGSFPAPPTHIPRTPTSPNPPPSRPPSSPLPPLPRALSIADPIDPRSARSTVFSPSSPPRSHSPDIPAIISATPRPRPHARRVHRHLDAPPSDDDDTRSWIDYDDCGRPLPRKDAFADLERHLDGFDSDASDSSLDLHTPLPHLMMRHGLLSPQSKLITARVPIASAHPLKDARDTVKRRVRHRDGRLLRGGIGLTTGLGWSDSEDEDAPSALTRRISSLNLTTRSSAPSLALSRSTISLSSVPSRSSSGTSDYHTSLPSRKSSSASTRPLARSYSSTTSLRISDYTPQVDEFGNIPPRKLTINTRGVVIPENEEVSSPDLMTLSELQGGALLTKEKSLTLQGGALLTRESSLPFQGGALLSLPLQGGALLTREKSLPPLPRSSVVGAPRRCSESGASPAAAVVDGRARSISAAESVRATITRAPMLKTPRPLRLASPTTPHAQAHAPLLLAQRQQRPQDRPPVPVPTAVAVSVDTLPPLLDSSRSTPSTPSTPSPVTPGERRPRPRVGTGMVYRSSVGRLRPTSSGPKSVLDVQKPIPL